MSATSTKKIVINTSHGEFCVSHKAFLRLRELGQQEAIQEIDLGQYWPTWAGPNEPVFNKCGALVPRDDLKLAQVVEELGAAANGSSAALKIVDIPSDVGWVIEKSYGVEHVSEQHRIWK
jgi:hypothetical protein